MNIIEQVRQSFNKTVNAAQFTPASGVLEIFISGSLARGHFYPRWSDIDVVVVGDDTISQSSFEALSGWRLQCMDLIGCKVGIDYVPYSYLQAIGNSDATTRSHLIAQGWHYLKNFHVGNQSTLVKGRMLSQDSYQSPVFPEKYYIHVDTGHYLASKKEQVYEGWLRRGASRADHLTTLRTTVKSCLYLLQADLLWSEGRLITEYPSLIRYCQLNGYAGLEVLGEVYSHRDNFDALDQSMINTYSKRALACFNQLHHHLAEKHRITYTQLVQ